jgi:hypothetical protein
MTDIDAELFFRLPLGEIESVVFYKRDEVTTDLVCCDVKVAGKTWMFHEEQRGWHLLMHHLHGLPGFRSDALTAISQPPFETSEIVAFSL